MLRRWRKYRLRAIKHSRSRAQVLAAKARSVIRHAQGIDRFGMQGTFALA